MARPYDAVVLHEPDATELVAGLHRGLQELGASIWSEASLRVGDNRWRGFDDELKGSRYGIVVVSSEMIRGDNPRLGAIIQRYVRDGHLLVVLHDVDPSTFAQRFPSLAPIVTTSSQPSVDVAVADLAGVLVPKAKRQKKLRRAPAWTVHVVCPAPLNVGTTATAHAFFLSIRRLRGQPFDVTFDAPLAQSAAGIAGTRNISGRSIVHIHTPYIRRQPVFEDLEFGVERSSIDELMSAIRTSRATLVLLTGADHGQLAREVSRTLNIPVVYSVKRFGDKQLPGVIRAIYMELFDRDLGEPVLPDGVEQTGLIAPLGSPAAGEVRSSETLRHFEQRARNGRSRVQSRAMHEAYLALRSHRSVQINAMAGSGVSTTLKILTDYLRIDTQEFFHGSATIDLRAAQSLEEILRATSEQLDVVARSFPELVTKHSIAFCIDGGDENPQLLHELVAQLALLEGHLKSRFVFGLEQRIDIRDCVAIDLRPLDRSEMARILRAEVGDKLAREYDSALSIAHPFPGSIYLIKNLISGPGGSVAGLSADALCEILASGETHSVVAGYCVQDPSLRPILKIISALGSHFPMEVARDAFEAELRDSGVSSPMVEFARVSVRLDSLGVWSASDADTFEHFYYPLDSSGSYYSVNPGMLEQIRERFPHSVSATDPDFIERVVRVVLHWLGSPNFPTSSSDGDWLTSAADAMQAWGRVDALASMASSLIESRSHGGGESVVPLRVNGDPTDLRRLLDVLRRATDRTSRDWPDVASQWLHERCLLFYAETCYKLNDIDTAVAQFIEQTELPGASDNLLIRAHRALGQIAFRGASYTEAREQFNLAASFSGSALPRFVVTLQIERAKLDLRHGNGREAMRWLSDAEALLVGAPSGGSGDKVRLEKGNLARLGGEFSEALESYMTVAGSELAAPAVRAVAAYNAILVAADGRLLGFHDPVAVHVALEVLTEQVKRNPGHELIGVLSMCSELLARTRGGLTGGGLESELSSISARLERVGRLDLLAEFRHALRFGAKYYEVPEGTRPN